jgi:hypothetical protein
MQTSTTANSRSDMSLSKQTIEQLSDVLIHDVIDTLRRDQRFNDMLTERIGDAVCRKLGSVNSDGTCAIHNGINSDLIAAIKSKIQISSISDADRSGLGILSHLRNRKL